MPHHPRHPLLGAHSMPGTWLSSAHTPCVPHPAMEGNSMTPFTEQDLRAQRCQQLEGHKARM